MFGIMEQWRSTSELDTLIKLVSDRMEMTDPESDEFVMLLAHLERLTKMKAQTAPARVSRDEIARVFGHLAGIFIIITFEQKHVMASKAPWNNMKP